jgi:hypothetical protein
VGALVKALFLPFCGRFGYIMGEQCIAGLPFACIINGVRNDDSEEDGEPGSCVSALSNSK